jgi:hypothetical protein
LRKPLPQGNGFFIACVWRCLGMRSAQG